MKCKICKRKTDWDSSFGMREFVVCPDCFNEMVQEKMYRTDKNGIQAHNEIMTALFNIGGQIKRIKERGAE